eukprot:JP439686.1.p2 GENE.JP439686.1~~JP439686.1.p2  ORF type:complete len:90 (-),score=11.88 JP439686.1:113-382(-)
MCKSLPQTEDETLAYLQSGGINRVLSPLSRPDIRELLSEQSVYLQTFLENLEEDSLYWVDVLQKGKYIHSRTLRKLTKRYCKLSRIQIC